MKRFPPIALPAVLGLLLAASCSTTRVLAPGQYRLEKNELIATGDPSFNTSELTPYLRQQPPSSLLFGWDPFLSIYNWSDGSDRFFSRLFRKIGVAPMVFSPAAVATSAENIRAHLQYLGYYGSTVRTETEEHGRKVRVRYLIGLGKRYQVDSIRYELPGKGAFAREFLADTAAVHRALRGRFLSEKTLEAESVRSAAHFRDLGYYTLNKNNYSFEADTLPGGRATLVYKVLPHGRGETPAPGDEDILRKFRFGNVRLAHDKDLPFRSSVLEGLNTIHPGAPYSEKTVSTTYSRLSSLRVFSSVGVELSQADSTRVDCDIHLTRTPLQGIKANVEASSNSSGLLGFSPQLSYFHRNIFHGGEWLSLGFSGNFQFKLGNQDQHSNEMGISAGLSIPKFLGLPYSFFKGASIPRTEINLAYNYQNRPEYIRHIFSFSYGYSGTTSGRLAYQIYPLQVNFVRLTDLDAGFNSTLAANPFMRYSYQDHLDAGLGATLYHNSSTEVIPRGSYRFHRLTFDLSGNALSLFRGMMERNADGAVTLWGSPFTQYVRGEYSTGLAWQPGGSEAQSVAVRFLVGAGYAYGNSTALPFEKQFYSGGASSMRGWQARELGPGYNAQDETFIIPSQTGDLKLEANLEYRFDVYWKFEGALFADLGNIWTLQHDDSAAGQAGAFHFNDFYRSLAADWGLGLRVNLNFILLRVDLGMKLYDPSREEGRRLVSPSNWLRKNGFAVHFGVGYPF